MQFTRTTLEIVIGRTPLDDRSGLLMWTCGCVAHRRGEDRFSVEPCHGHEDDFVLGDASEGAPPRTRPGER